MNGPTSLPRGRPAPSPPDQPLRLQIEGLDPARQRAWLAIAQVRCGVKRDRQVVIDLSGELSPFLETRGESRSAGVSPAVAGASRSRT